MNYKTEPIPREIVFDIYDNLDTKAAHELIKKNFDELDREEKKRIIHGESRLWLIRKSSEPGALTIESLRYNSNRVLSNDDSNKWIPQAPIRLQLTENGWQGYAGSNAPGLRAITKENISDPVLSDLKKKLDEYPSLEPQNMIYPEIVWATQDKKRKETSANAIHGSIARKVPNEEKGILRRDPSIEQKPQYSNNIETPLETARDAPTRTPESIVYSKDMTPNGIQSVLHSKLRSLDSNARANLLAAGGSVWLIREGSEPDTLTVEAL
jgi:hypothetical protein